MKAATTRRHTDELTAFLQLPSWIADFLRYRLAGE